MNKELVVLESREVLGKEFKIYGDVGNLLFLAKDVAGWIDHSNSRMMLQSVDAEEKLCVNNPYALKGQQEQWFLTEDGLYEVLMQSRKPIAKQFKKEVKKILKQIRLTGGAVSNEEEFIKNYFPSFSEEVKQAMVLDLKAQNEKIQKELDEKNKFLGQITASNTTMLIRDVAHLATKKDIKIGERKLFQKLRDWKLIGKDNKPYQKSLQMGLFEVNEYVINTNNGTKLKHTTKVTGKGQIYIINRLLKEKDNK